MTGRDLPGQREESLERTAFVGLVVLLLSPVVAHGLWLPLVHRFGAPGGSGRVTAVALATGVVVALVRRLRPGWAAGRLVLAGGLVAAAGAALWSLGLPGLLSLLGVAAASAWLAPWLSARLPSAFDGLLGRNRVLGALYVLGALSSVVSTARLSVFIGDPSRVEMQVMPGEKFTETHSCLSAYTRASSLVRQGADNLYEDRWWHGSHGLPPLPAGVEHACAPFALDNFSYPPPFFLVASPLALLEGDFLAQRALWFGLNGLLLASGLWTVARWIGGPGAHRSLLLAPLFFGSLPVLLTLQIGNFHLAVVVLSVLAMAAFDRERTAAGGALLALGILTKISPGVLGIVLLVRRRLRAVAATAICAGLLLALTALWFGVGPLVSFVSYALPRLSSGAAFPFMDTDTGIVTNMAPFGIPFKLRLLGLHVGDPWLVAPWIVRVFTLALVALAVLGARRRGRREQAMGWMSLLTLSALQSPFSPAYAALGLLWATTLLATEVRGWLRGSGLVALWLLILIVPPGLSMEARAIQSMGQTGLLIAACAWLILRAPRGLELAP